MKSIFARFNFIFATTQTIGMLVSYFLVLRHLNEVVVREWLPILLIITFASSLVCSLKKTKDVIWSDLLASFLAYNLATYIYLVASALYADTSLRIFADFFNMAVFMAVSYPMVLKALVPAVLTSLCALLVYRKLYKK